MRSGTVSSRRATSSETLDRLGIGRGQTKVGHWHVELLGQRFHELALGDHAEPDQLRAEPLTSADSLGQRVVELLGGDQSRATIMSPMRSWPGAVSAGASASLGVTVRRPPIPGCVSKLTASLALPGTDPVEGELRSPRLRGRRVARVR